MPETIPLTTPNGKVVHIPKGLTEAEMTSIINEVDNQPSAQQSIASGFAQPGAISDLVSVVGDQVSKAPGFFADLVRGIARSAIQQQGVGETIGGLAPLAIPGAGPVAQAALSGTGASVGEEVQAVIQNLLADKEGRIRPNQTLTPFISADAGFRSGGVFGQRAETGVISAATDLAATAAFKGAGVVVPKLLKIPGGLTKPGAKEFATETDDLLNGPLTEPVKKIIKDSFGGEGSPFLLMAGEGGTGFVSKLISKFLDAAPLTKGRRQSVRIGRQKILNQLFAENSPLLNASVRGKALGNIWEASSSAVSKDFIVPSIRKTEFASLKLLSQRYDELNKKILGDVADVTQLINKPTSFLDQFGKPLLATESKTGKKIIPKGFIDSSSISSGLEHDILVATGEILGKGERLINVVKDNDGQILSATVEGFDKELRPYFIPDKGMRSKLLTDIDNLIKDQPNVSLDSAIELRSAWLQQSRDLATTKTEGNARRTLVEAIGNLNKAMEVAVEKLDKTGALIKEFKTLNSDYGNYKLKFFGSKEKKAGMFKIRGLLDSGDTEGLTDLFIKSGSAREDILAIIGKDKNGIVQNPEVLNSIGDHLIGEIWSKAAKGSGDTTIISGESLLQSLGGSLNKGNEALVSIYGKKAVGNMRKLAELIRFSQEKTTSSPGDLAITFLATGMAMRSTETAFKTAIASGGFLIWPISKVLSSLKSDNFARLLSTGMKVGSRTQKGIKVTSQLTKMFLREDRNQAILDSGSALPAGTKERTKRFLENIVGATKKTDAKLQLFKTLGKLSPGIQEAVKSRINPEFISPSRLPEPTVVP